MKKTEIRLGGGARDRQSGRVPAVPDGSGMDAAVEDILFSVESPCVPRNSRSAVKQDDTGGEAKDEN